MPNHPTQPNKPNGQPSYVWTCCNCKQTNYWPTNTVCCHSTPDGPCEHKFKRGECELEIRQPREGQAPKKA